MENKTQITQNILKMQQISLLSYAFFCVIPQHLKFICRRFGTFCLFHLHRQVGACRMN